MSSPSKRHTDSAMMTGVGYLAILAVTLLGIQSMEPGLLRIIGVSLLALFTILFALVPPYDVPPWRIHAHIGLMATVITSLMGLGAVWSVFPILFFLLSPIAMMAFPTRVGLGWIGIFTGLTAIIFFTRADPLSAIMVLLPYTAGYLFFGAFARSLNTAEEARSQSQQLLSELQQAHRQLQDYAARAEELAISEERNRLAREMHDTLGHRLTVAAVQLEGAQRLISQDPERASEMVATVREQVREALTELRRTVATLRESLEADLNLPTALQRLVDSFQKATHLTIHLVTPTEFPPLPDSHRLALYRTAQEALTNIHKHAGANQAWVNLTFQGNTVILRVRDDGGGITENGSETGFGLRGLRERATQLGGGLRLHNTEGHGTLLEIILPLVESQSDV